MCLRTLAGSSPVESPYIEWVGHGYTVADGLEMRPAEYNWHLNFTRQAGVLRTLVVGALELARPLSYTAGAESLWIRFRVGTFLPKIRPTTVLNREIELPVGSGNNFWLSDRVLAIPTFENADTFAEHLMPVGALACDPLVDAALRDELAGVPNRTIRHHFRHSTGLRRGFIRQIRRAQQAVRLLRQGNPPLDTAHELGYSDQPHLTRSLKRFLGDTPGGIQVSSPQAG